MTRHADRLPVSCEKRRGFKDHSQVFRLSKQKIDIPPTEVRKIMGEVSGGRKKKVCIFNILKLRCLIHVVKVQQKMILRGKIL